MSKTDLSRRTFLKGAALGAVGAVAASGLAGCASGSESSSESSSAQAEVSEASATSSETAPTPAPNYELIPQAYVNPQDYDYRSNTVDLETLFSPWQIGPLTINHRMVKSAAGSATYLAGYTDELYQYYLNLAKGGVELIWVEGEAFVMPTDGSPVPQEAIDFFQRLTTECAGLGAHLGFQWAPFGIDVAEMPVETIYGIEDAGVALAQQLQAMGFAGIEINSAGFNQGHMFLSRYHNKREDEYGPQSIDNRTRFDVECIQKIKEACGSDFIVQMLIEAVEENDNIDNSATLMDLDNTVTSPYNLATTVDESIAMAVKLEEAGADSFHLRLGPLNNHPCQFGNDLYFILNGVEGASGFGTQFDFSKHFGGELIANHSGAGMLIDIVSRFKQAVSVPCGCVTYMDPAHAPDFFEQALADGKVDFYMMTRPLTVDTEYVNKLRDGRIDEIAPCTRCLHCHIGSNELNAMFGYCRVNALTQRVMREGGPTTYELPPAEAAKNVMVIGGGPAGMEAARIAAARGHNVTLYEKTPALGGLLSFASYVKGPHENLDDLSAYLVKQCELNNVNVQTGTEVTSEMIDSEAPDAVILAVGGLRDTLNVPNAQVVEMDDFVSADMGDNIIVYGSNAQAFDAALWLTVHKKNVQIVTPSSNDDLDMQQSQHAKRFMTSTLYALGVKVWPQSEIMSYEDGRLTIHSAEKDVEVSLPCDAIINAADMLPNTGLLDGVSVEETYTIGDCAEPFNIAMAIRAGNDAGRAV